MLLTFPLDQHATVMEIIQETVSSPDGSKFASEFVRRWYSEMGVPADQIKNVPTAPPRSAVADSSNSNQGFKVVKSKKRGKKLDS
jgi:hypothetical protein